MYQVLYRKYRPQVFRDVVGQEHVTSTLTNELASGRLSHAYLFTGTRGTGKTTCAKILAKAMNCLHPENGDPCNRCEVCRGIDNGSIFDVVEIDAASNNGVDNIRDLREEANFTPSVCKYRVYIIDEVHMLSPGAFNALLKTLEEPPEHVKFILATTEIHKLPATILSRCQRFDFKRISSEAMAKRLHYVAEQEGFTLSEDGALLIARIADGALRDALSILDQCAGRGSRIDGALVSEVCGIANKDYLYRLSDDIQNRDASDALALIDALHQNSCDMERLCTELIHHYRNFLILKTVKNNRELILATDEEYRMMAKKITGYSTEAVLFALDLFQETLEHMKRGANRRTEMEMAFIKLCAPELESGTDALLTRIAALERAVQAAASSAALPQQLACQTEAAPPPAKPAPDIPPPPRKEARNTPDSAEQPQAAAYQPAPADEPPCPPESAAERLAPAVPPTPTPGQPAENGADRPFPAWKQVMDRIFELDKPLYGVLSGSSAMQREDFILIDSSNPTIREFIKISAHNKAIKQAIFEVTGSSCRLGILRRSDVNRQQAQQEDPLERLARMAQGSGIDVTIR